MKSPRIYGTNTTPRPRQRPGRGVECETDSKSRMGDYLLARTPGTPPRYSDRSASAPLRPSEGLRNAFPRVLKPCPADRQAAPLNTNALGMPESRTFVSKVGAAQGDLSLQRLSKHAERLTNALTRSEVGTVAPPAAAPHNIDAEQRLLGTLIVFYTPQAAEKVRATGLKPGDFYWRCHEVVYRALLALNGAGEWVDTLTVTRFLDAHPHASYGTWLVAAGGPARVEALASMADANGLYECARMVAEDGRWRRWMYAMYGALDAVYARDDDGFWAAVARVREDVLPGELHVVKDEEQAA